MSLPQKIKIVEVSPRDGLQNEHTPIPTKLKIQLIQALSKTGLSSIEITSYVSPKWVPQLGDHHEVAQGLDLDSKIHYIALTPNRHGLESALEDKIKHIAVFTSGSETFSQKNTNSSINESLKEIEAVILKAKKNNLTIRGYISCVIGCPYEGPIAPEKTAFIAKALHKMGCDEISLGDTIGVGTPLLCKQLIAAVTQHVPLKNLAVHFHDTYGQALANIYSALESGISIVDSSAAGLGGCPYAPGAGGNVATEDVLFLCQGLKIETGVDLAGVANAGKIITDYLQITPRSKAAVALHSRKFW
jgi:hydroxymethylglutaryl-CoA lyase